MAVAHASEVRLAGFEADEETLESVYEEDGTEDESESLLPSVDVPFDVKIRFDDQYEVLTKADTAGWRMVRGRRYIWDDEKVADYFQQLKEKYDDYGNIKFITHTGQTVFIPSGNCGWQMNVDVSVQWFEEAVDSGKDVVDPAWNSGLIYCSENGVGTKYVEVDIEEQKVYLFEDGKLIMESECVTGTENGISDTEKGVFQVVYKASPSVLKDVSPNGYEYEQPVNYWVAFNGSQGFHDATWRGQFGGDIYKYNGSYGCVNLPLEAAETIYSEVYTFYPVVVH